MAFFFAAVIRLAQIVIASSKYRAHYHPHGASLQAWGSIGVGAGGLALAALTLIFTHRERTSSYRQAIYAKQIEAIEALTLPAQNLHGAALSLITTTGAHGLAESQRQPFRQALLPAMQEFQTAHQRWSPFLSKEVNDALARFQTAIFAISATSDIARLYPSALVASTDPGKDISEVFSTLIRAMRKGLGVDALSGQTLKVIRRWGTKD